MMVPLKLYWSRSKPNFGDWLSPLVCEMLSGRRVEFAPIERCDLVAIGSLFDRLPERWYARRLDVWGTGSIEETSVRRSRHKYHALRGPLTARLLSEPPAVALGDPGLLAAHLLPERRPHKRFQVGIVPHYKDAASSAISGLGNAFCKVSWIDVFDPPLDVVKQVSACECVLSSSLHGLVVAEALSIPAWWVVASDAVRGHGWKFRDHYAATGLENPRGYLPAEIAAMSLDSLMAARPGPELESCREGLVRSFPYRP